MTSKTFPGRFDSLADIRGFVVKAAEQAGFDERDVYAVELAVDEACTNIIEHAYGGENQGEIECDCDVVSGDLVIVLKDSGRPFIPEEIPEPNFAVDLDELKPRGAGLFLMKKMMDSVKFKFGKRGTTLTMVKKKK